MTAPAAKGLIERLANYGGIGILAGILLWQSIQTQDRLFQTIENNTQALIELKTIIERDR